MGQSVVLTDPATGSTAEVAVDQGFNCFRFSVVTGDRTIEVIDAPADFASGSHRPSSHGIPILFPFPNRIRDGRYHWQGVDYEIPESVGLRDPEGNAIHGFCIDLPWRVIRQEANSVTGEFQLSRDAPSRRDSWPADFILQLTWSLEACETGGALLRSDFRISNPGETPLPWGLGTHPYFRLPLAEGSTAADCLVEAPATEAWSLVNCLPTGERTPVPGAADLRRSPRLGELQLDDVLTGLPSDKPVESRVMDPAAGLEVVQQSDPLFRELVVYTPGGRDAVCIEPYTCVTDAIRLEADGIDTGLQVLRPGAEATTWITISAGPVLA